MTAEVTTDLDTQHIRPSAFVAMGQPMCSRWGKSEIEWIALAYVQALANSGDTWQRLSREQTVKALTDDQRRQIHGLLDDDYYQGWFDAVSDQINSAEGAFGVRGFWNEFRFKKLQEAPHVG